MSITVITSTIGRPELRQCIESVKSQSVRCTHYVFVNGPEFHSKARAILKDYPDVHALYLQESTGDYGMGPSMADVFAASPYLTRSKWILFLDDDNWYDKDHVQSLWVFANQNNLKWAYSLRKLMAPSGEFICNDNWDSLGHWSEEYGRAEDQFLVDNSCYFVDRQLAARMSAAWTAMAHYADRCFFIALKEAGEKSGCTGLYTVNYRTGSSNKTPADEYLKADADLRKHFNDGYPWAKPRVF